MAGTRLYSLQTTNCDEKQQESIRWKLFYKQEQSIANISIMYYNSITINQYYYNVILIHTG